MKVYKYVHSCILLEDQGRGLLFDPGAFGFAEGRVDPDKFIDLDAIVITHNHPDHLDIDALRSIAAANSKALILTNAQIAEQLRQTGLEATVFEEGQKQCGPFTIDALRARHGPILIPEPQNCAYRVNGQLIHPGDSFDPLIAETWSGPPLLLLPVAAPWMREIDALAFAKAVRPAAVFPIHDGFYRDFFREACYRRFSDALQKESIAFHSPEEVSEPFEL